MKKFVCPVCGYVHVGEFPPEKCPQCGASLFKKTGRMGKIYCAKEGCGYERPLDSADSKDKNNDG